MAADLALSDADFDAKYGPMRTMLDAAYRRRRATALVDRLLGRAETMVLGARARKPLEAPVFVTGSYRSGTTMLERILSKHSTLGSFDHLGYSFPTAPLASDALRRMMPGSETATVAPDQPNMKLRSSTPAECEPIWLFSRGHLWSDAPSHVLGAEHRDPAFERVFVATANKLLLRQKRRRFMNKNPLLTLRVGYLARLFPDARFVHLVRHPLRVVRSQLDLERMWARVLDPVGGGRDWARAFVDAFMPPGRTFPRTKRWKEIQGDRLEEPSLAVAKSLVDFEEAFDDAVSRGGLEERVLRVRYEDVLGNPREWILRIFEHMGLQGEEAGEIAEVASRDFVDRGMISRRSSLPRFDEPTEQALGSLFASGGYDLKEEPAGGHGA